MISAEFVQCPKNPNRARKLLKLLAKEYGAPLLERPTFSKDFLFIWGGGGVVQQSHLVKQRAAGGVVVFMDLGYFGRSADGDKGSIRITFNELHPIKYFHLVPDDRSRLDRECLQLENYEKPTGPIILCGLGRKSRAFFGFRGMEWEENTLEAIRTAYPDSEVVYRPKPKHKETLAGAKRCPEIPFDRVAKSASLVVAKHSNVGVDCAVLGVPCIASDGLGSILWGSDISNPKAVPSLEERKKFLSGVSWFNWYLHETKELLEFVESIADGVLEVSRGG